MKQLKVSKQEGTATLKRKQTGAAKRPYGKDAAITTALAENTKQLKLLIEEVKELKRCINEK